MNDDRNGASGDPLGRLMLREAAERMAGQAEALAGEMEQGAIADCGGPEALRLLAAVVRLDGARIEGWGASSEIGHA